MIGNDRRRCGLRPRRIIGVWHRVRDDQRDQELDPDEINAPWYDQLLQGQLRWQPKPEATFVSGSSSLWRTGTVTPKKKIDRLQRIDSELVICRKGSRGSTSIIPCSLSTSADVDFAALLEADVACNTERVRGVVLVHMDWHLELCLKTMARKCAGRSERSLA